MSEMGNEKAKLIYTQEKLKQQERETDHWRDKYKSEVKENLIHRIGLATVILVLALGMLVHFL